MRKKPVTTLLQCFKNARTLFWTFELQQRQAQSEYSDLIAEARRRLEDLESTVDQIRRAQAAQHRLYQSGPRSATGHAKWARRQRELGRNVERLSESFYYFAWRFVKILQRVAFSKKFAPGGVCFVRNDLLEHPKVLNPNFLYGHDVDEGPRIKPFPGRTPCDAGLDVNAQELLDQLIPRLQRTLGEKGGQ